MYRQRRLVSGGDTEGLLIGATAGVLKGGAESRKKQQQAQQQAATQQQQQQATQQQQAATQQQHAMFNKGFAACSESPRYTGR
jgi:transcription initiation factor TFIID subunit TAF12